MMNTMSMSTQCKSKCFQKATLIQSMRGSIIGDLVYLEQVLTNLKARSNKDSYNGTANDIHSWKWLRIVEGDKWHVLSMGS